MTWWLVGFHGWGRHEEVAGTSAQQGRQAGRWAAVGCWAGTTACRCALQSRALIEIWSCNLTCKVASSTKHRQEGYKGTGMEAGRGTQAGNTCDGGVNGEERRWSRKEGGWNAETTLKAA